MFIFPFMTRMINLNYFLQESSVRQASLVDMNVCCSEKELKPEAKNEVNWSITKDPKRCKEFAKDGYRYAYPITKKILFCTYSQGYVADSVI